MKTVSAWASFDICPLKQFQYFILERICLCVSVCSVNINSANTICKHKTNTAKISFIFNSGDTPITIDDKLLSDIEADNKAFECSFLEQSAPPLINTYVLKSEKHRHSQALLAMSVFAFSRQDGVGRTRFAGFCQVRSRQKGRRITQFKAAHGSVRFGQAGLTWRGVRALWAGYGGLEGRWVPRRFWRGWTIGKGMATAFDEARLAKRRVRRKEGVSPRIDWLRRVCIGLRQEGLARRAVGALPCPFGGHVGKEGLAKSCAHRFC